jgi:endonuclease-3 related protein
MELIRIYEALLTRFGPQGWWPMGNGFRPREWEVCVGAVLTQNTAWSNVEKALESLKESRCTDVETMMRTDTEALGEMVHPSGFYKQKAIKLRALGEAVMGFGSIEDFLKSVTREQLLEIKGIGPETADSILLYACGRPYFVVDAYTRRIFSRLGLVKEDMDYEDIGVFFEANLPKDSALYGEFHALIVRLAKEHCRKKPSCGGCPLEKGCRHISEK